jgi:glucosamine--fructose-6-phosphate aminotransferase (isomerizing)
MGGIVGSMGSASVVGRLVEALTCFFIDGQPDLLIGARKGAPSAVGYGDGEMNLGFDATALAPFTETISYLVDGEEEPIA